MPLLFDRSSEFHKFLGYWLICRFEHVDQCPGLGFIMIREKCNGKTICARTSCSNRGISIRYSSSSSKNPDVHTFRFDAHNPQR